MGTKCREKKRAQMGPGKRANFASEVDILVQNETVGSFTIARVPRDVGLHK